MNFKFIEGKCNMTQGDFMKLLNQFNVLPKYLSAFNYAGLYLNETPKELEQETIEMQTFWDKE